MSEHKDCYVEPLEKPLNEAAIDNAKAAYLAVWGMGCSRCAMRVRNGLLRLEHILFAEAFLEKGLAIAAYDPQGASTDDLITAVAKAGNDSRHNYRAKFVGEAPAAEVLFLFKADFLNNGTMD